MVSAFDYGPYREAARLFRRLAAQFEFSIFGLNRVKAELQAMREERYQAWRRPARG